MKRGPSALATPIASIDTSELFRLGPCEKPDLRTPVDNKFELLARILVASDVIRETPGKFERVRQSFCCRCEFGGGIMPVHDVRH
jgi:hypothetical protein